MAGSKIRYSAVASWLVGAILLCGTLPSDAGAQTSPAGTPPGQLICLPARADLARAATDPQTYPVLVLPDVTLQRRRVASIDVFESDATGRAGALLTTVAPIPGQRAQPGSPTQQRFFLPREILAPAASQQPICVRVQINGNGAAASDSDAAISLETQVIR